MRKEIEYLLFDSGVTVQQISEFTSISMVNIIRYISGELKGSDMRKTHETMLTLCFEDLWERCCEEFGYISINDVMIAVTKTPTPAKIDGKLYDESLGIDEEGNTYPLRWEC